MINPLMNDADRTHATVYTVVRTTNYISARQSHLGISMTQPL